MSCSACSATTEAVVNPPGLSCTCAGLNAASDALQIGFNSASPC